MKAAQISNQSVYLLSNEKKKLKSLEKEKIDLNVSCAVTKSVQDELTFQLAQSKLEQEKSEVMYRNLISELEIRIHRLSREKEDISIDLITSQINSDYLNFTLDENEMTIETLEERLIVLQYRIIDRHRQWPTDNRLCMKRTDLKQKNDQLNDQIQLFLKINWKRKWHCVLKWKKFMPTNLLQ